MMFWGKKRKRKPARRKFAGSLERLESRDLMTAVPGTIDSFDAQPLQGESQEFAYYNNWGGDRGEVVSQFGSVDWHQGYIRAAISQDFQYAGIFESLNGLIRNSEVLDFAAPLPASIQAAYQSQIEALNFEFRDGQGPVTFKLESPSKATIWTTTRTISGPTNLRLALPTPLPANVHALVVTVDGNAGNFYELNKINAEFNAPALGNLEPVIWSAAPLLALYDEDLHISADRQNFGADEMANIPVTGGTALVAAELARFGVVSTAAAEQLVDEITSTFLILPTYHGLLPHFAKLKTPPSGGNPPEFENLPGGEWSSVDTVIGLLAVIEARQMLGLSTAAIEAKLENIDWEDLTLADGTISHGYQNDGTRIAVGWDVFGSESFLVGWGLAAARPGSSLASLNIAAPPTWDGAEFNDELAALFLPMNGVDHFGNDWEVYRATAAQAQWNYYDSLGVPIAGLSPAEVAEPWTVPQSSIYQAFGLGGHNGTVNDGSALTGHIHAAPHALGLLASHLPSETLSGWQYLKTQEVVSPLNVVESMYLTDQGDVVANPLKSGWNLLLQTLGWTRMVAAANYGAYEAAAANEFVTAGFERMMPPPPTPWQNAEMPLDVDADTDVDVVDAILVINELLTRGPHPLTDQNDLPPPYFDVNGNNEVDVVDAILVINHLLSGSNQALPLEGDADTKSVSVQASSASLSPDDLDIAWGTLLESESHRTPVAPNRTLRAVRQI